VDSELRIFAPECQSHASPRYVERSPHLCGALPLSSNWTRQSCRLRRRVQRPSEEPSLLWDGCASRHIGGLAGRRRPSPCTAHITMRLEPSAETFSPDSEGEGCRWCRVQPGLWIGCARGWDLRSCRSREEDGAVARIAALHPCRGARAVVRRLSLPPPLAGQWSRGGEGGRGLGAVAAPFGWVAVIESAYKCLVHV
jgi:hypothetical protein